MTQKFWYSISFYLICLICPAQIYDNFTYADLKSDSCFWSGQVDSFQINADYQLQLNAHQGNAYLSRTLPHLQRLEEWNFWIALNFSPSENNQLRIYLAADSVVLPLSQNAYYLQFGENGTHDAIELYHKQNGISYLICRGSNDLVAKAFKLNFKVIRNDTLNTWKILTDHNHDGLYQLEAASSDTMDKFSMTHCGFWCQYTASNAQAFYFDNVYIGPRLKDTLPPRIVKAEARLKTQQIQLFFNELLDSASALESRHYYLRKPFLYQPKQVEFSENAATIILTFDSIFIQDRPDYVYVTQIKDLENNTLIIDSICYLPYSPKADDVIFSELMIKPSPAIDLPKAEYIEIYNRTDYDILLNQWTLKIGNNLKTLPDSLLKPKEYYVICTTAFKNAFKNCILISDFQLPDGGQSLLLSDAKGQQIDYVHYQSSWYHDKHKTDGGWSLERSNFDEPCAGAQSWSASLSIHGGTPCLPNSVEDQALSFEDEGYIEIINTHQIVLHLKNRLNRNELEDLSFYQITPELKIQTAKIVYPELNSVCLTLSDTLKDHLFYTLIIKKDLSNCQGIVLQKNRQYAFGIPEIAEPHDLVFNEILIKPWTENDVEFIEFYNRSDKLLNLADFKISFRSAGKTTKPKRFSDFWLLFPKEYAVLSKNGNNIKQNYNCPQPEKIINSDSVPTLSNSEGLLILSLYNLTTIDSLSYNSSMHHPLLLNTDGVSLERIYTDMPTSHAMNWTSASESVGYGTPTGRNSQYRNFESQALLHVFPEVFSPDNDGFDDQCTISYQLDNENAVGSVYIYNIEGQKIRTLANHVIFGTEGYYIWDGLNDQQGKVQPGSYLLIFEYKPPDGPLRRRKVLITLAVKMN